MSEGALKTTMALLAKARKRIYAELRDDLPVERQRELLDQAHDLLLAEEILNRCAPELTGDTTFAPKSSDADKGEWDHVGEFTRLVRGGVINEGKAGREIFVPESVVRAEGIEHGDIVGARDKGSNEKGTPQYFFQVLERRGLGHASGRTGFVAVLEMRGGVWGAYNEDEEMFISVPDNDIQAFDLEEGDLVEIAYEKGHPAKARVAWKYDASEAFIELHERQRVKKKRERAKDEPDALLLDGKRVLVVGADAYKESFKRLFERLGAEFSWESGFMVGRFLESKVNRADIVVIVTEAMKHKMPDVEDVCKRLGRPYVYAPSRGATGAVREVLRKLDLLDEE
ncbi:DUF2325 domain-containing protein [Desulforudis sp. 1088]|uniref:DUF2325 domain-containing protein n=1 Tax=unclassified Candidatus Desulforudis TaxID=2635950 RepID=UPI003491EB24